MVLFIFCHTPSFKPVLYLKGLLVIHDLFQQVTELSRPSSLEVEDIIHQLAQNVLRRFFKDETTSDYMGDSVNVGTKNHPDGDELCDSIGTSRDYLAKLLFWLVFVTPLISCFFSGYCMSFEQVTSHHVHAGEHTSMLTYTLDVVAGQGLFLSY